MVKAIQGLLILALIARVVSAQGTGSTEAGLGSTLTVETDSTDAADTTADALAASIEDSILLVFPRIQLDTLTEAQRLLADFETRFHLRQIDQRRIELSPSFSYFDSLVSYYLDPNWNLRDDIDRSFYHDAADYFKSDPAHFVLEPQTTPMRKTVQPFGLSGHRLGLLIGGRPLRPFEHIVEPDGLIDFNDVPTALDHTVAILPGPVGMLFGSDHSAATLLTLPKPPAGTDPESSFLVDKGSFAYSYARGRYVRNFVTGRRVDMSIGYRSADGLVFGRGDDAYHYTGNVLLPLGSRQAIRFAGRLYDRRGPYPVRPAKGGRTVDRDRFDRSADVVFVVHNEAHTVKHEIGYSHLRQASRLNDGYRMNLNQTGHGLNLAREWMWGLTAVKTVLRGDYLKFDSWHERLDRWTGSAGLSLARLTRPVGVAIDLKQTYVKDYRFLPSASVMVRRETDRSHLMLAGAYSERAPSLYELHLPYQEADLYATGGINYADGGYSNLVSEKQLIGSAEISLGGRANRISVTASGGRIWDGIDWLSRGEGNLTVFTPVNGRVDWTTVSTTTRVGLSSFLHFKGGGSYHYLDYENFADRPYSPEYQAFSGMELYLFWSQKLINLFAYGEVVYTGPYHGLQQQDLGKQAIVNIKLSFIMGHFRFHWISQNTTSQSYFPKDYWVIPGRYNSYGFTWDFID